MGSRSRRKKWHKIWVDGERTDRRGCHYIQVRLTEADMEMIKNFAIKVAKTTVKIEFNQKDTKPRSEEDIIHDTRLGKTAELAVARYIEKKYGVKCEVDFRIYPVNKGDTGDIIVNNWSIDIKATKIGYWLMYEVDRLDQHINHSTVPLPNAMILCRTMWNDKEDAPTGTVRIYGIMSAENLMRPNSRSRLLRKNTCIPHTKTSLQADNMASYAGWLYPLNETLEKYILNEDKTPPDQSLYKTLLEDVLRRRADPTAS